MGNVTVQTLTVFVYILGFAWCTAENTTLRFGAGIVTAPRNNSSVRPETQIVDGEEAGKNEFPHHVHLSAEVPTNGQRASLVCGGSLVTRNYVLTAAHCVYEMDIKNIRIWAGIVRTTPPDSTRQVSNAEKVTRNYVLTAAHCMVNMNRDKIRIFAGNRPNDRGIFEHESNAARVFVHKYYDPQSLQAGHIFNDIALVKLGQPFTLNGAVATIKIDVQNRAQVGTAVTVIGWGQTSYVDETSYSYELNKAQLNIISEQECKSTYPIPLLNYDNLVCASASPGSACEGDSGGPLICTGDGTNTKYVCGIASFFPRVGCSMGPSGYTRVSHFKNWIEDVVKHGRDSSKDCVGEGPGSLGSLFNSNGFSYAVVVLISFQYLM